MCELNMAKEVRQLVFQSHTFLFTLINIKIYILSFDLKLFLNCTIYFK